MAIKVTFKNGTEKTYNGDMTYLNDEAGTLKIRSSDGSKGLVGSILGTKSVAVVNMEHVLSWEAVDEDDEPGAKTTTLDEYL